MFSRSNLVMSRWRSSLPTFARRAIQADQMELDSALSQMYSLCTNPSLVSKMSRARMMTKGHYYRDDPAFLVLQLVFIAIATVAYSFAVRSFDSVWSNLFYAFANFFVSGLILACVGRAVAVMYLSPPSPHGSSQDAPTTSSGSGLDTFTDYLRSDVDWRYAFDVHCNGYFTYFMWTSVLQYITCPITARSTFLSNAFFLAGTISYLYNTFLGYLEIPSLVHQQRLLYPVPVAGFVFLVMWIGDFNMFESMVRGMGY